MTLLEMIKHVIWSRLRNLTNPNIRKVATIPIPVIDINNCLTNMEIIKVSDSLTK